MTASISEHLVSQTLPRLPGGLVKFDIPTTLLFQCTDYFTGVVYVYLNIWV